MSDKNTISEKPDDWAKIELNSYEGDEPYIFVSYSHADTAAVYEVLKLLDREKFRYWYDDTMEIGEDFREELRWRIENCSAFLLFVSESSMRSKYCGMEIITAFKHDKKIYPVYLTDDVEIPAPLKMILENLQHVKGVSKNNSDKYIGKLISGLPVEAMRSLETNGDVLVRCKDGSTALSVPAGVHTIGGGAFKNCERLERIDFGGEVEILQREAFRGCKALSRVFLPKNVRKIGESAFRDCISMTELVVECDEPEIGERSFENCSALTSITLSDGITEIYGGAFNSCKALTEIRLPEKLTIVGESAFADCAKLKAVDVPLYVTKLDDMVFDGCTELESVDLKNNLNKIGKNCFKDCMSLKRVDIPASVNSIGSGVFRGCLALERIDVDPKNKWYKSLDNVLFNKNKSTLICYPAKLAAARYTVPDSVTVINDWAFCAAPLEYINIPDSVCEIGEGAFYACASLKEVVVPDSVTRIDDSAFRGCSALTEVTLPDSVVEFGWGLFSGCDNVTVVCADNSAAAKYCELKNVKHKCR